MHVTYNGHRFHIRRASDGTFDVILEPKHNPDYRELLADGFTTEHEALEAAKEISNDL